MPFDRFDRERQNVAVSPVCVHSQWVHEYYSILFTILLPIINEQSDRLWTAIDMEIQSFSSMNLSLLFSESSSNERDVIPFNQICETILTVRVVPGV